MGSDQEPPGPDGPPDEGERRKEGRRDEPDRRGATRWDPRPRERRRDPERRLPGEDNPKPER